MQLPLKEALSTIFELRLLRVIVRMQFIVIITFFLIIVQAGPSFGNSSGPLSRTSPAYFYGGNPRSLRHLVMVNARLAKHT
jgi:hypothetical protein